MKIFLSAAIVLLACAIPVDPSLAVEDRTGEKLLAAAEGLQMPSSEADSIWNLAAFPGVGTLPEAESFEEISGCGQGGVTRYEFDDYLDRLSRVEPWMDAGQVQSARGFRKLAKLFEHEFGDEVAVYRCDTGGPEIPIYFVGVERDGLVGLRTISIET